MRSLSSSRLLLSKRQRIPACVPPEAPFPSRAEKGEKRAPEEKVSLGILSLCPAPHTVLASEKRQPGDLALPKRVGTSAPLPLPRLLLKTGRGRERAIIEDWREVNILSTSVILPLSGSGSTTQILFLSALVKSVLCFRSVPRRYLKEERFQREDGFAKVLSLACSLCNFLWHEQEKVNRSHSSKRKLIAGWMHICKLRYDRPPRRFARF
jgi:hypothetical protein